MRLSISEVLERVEQAQTFEDKVAVLRNNDSPALRNILRTCLDPNVKILLPDTDPPYTPQSLIGLEMMLHNQQKMLYLFIEGQSPPNLQQWKREKIFIDILENIHPDDAKVMLHWKNKKFAQPSVTAKLVRKAFPKLF